MTSPLAKLQMLIDLSVHPNTPKEEARTAALIACKMIRAENLVIRPGLLPGFDNDLIPRRPTAYEARSQKDRASNEKREKRAEARRSTVEEGDIPKRDPNDPRTWRTPGKFRRLTSKYSGTCRKCSVGYDAGDVIAWFPDRGATHWHCRGFWSTPEANK
jgi:hypothetical protein